MKETESNIQAAICNYLAARRYLFWRQNTAPTYDRAGGFFRAMPKYAMRCVTAPRGAGTHAHAPVRVAFRSTHSVGASGRISFAAQWLAYALPCRRFVLTFTDNNARLGADVDRYSFIAVDLHHLLLAGLPAHAQRNPSYVSRCLQARVSMTTSGGLRYRAASATVAERQRRKAPR